MTEDNFELILQEAMERIQLFSAHPGLEVRCNLVVQKMIKRAKLDQVPRQVLFMAAMTIVLGIIQEDHAKAEQSNQVELVQ